MVRAVDGFEVVVRSEIFWLPSNELESLDGFVLFRTIGSVMQIAEKAQRWFGVRQGPLHVGIYLGVDQLWMLALRPDLDEVTAFGDCLLPLGSSDNGRVLDAKTLIEALTALRVELGIPAGVSVASVFSPRVVYVQDHDPDAMMVDVHRRLLSAQCRVLADSGFGSIRLDPIPAAFARGLRTYVHSKEFCSGYGWRLGSSADRLVVERSVEMAERTLVANSDSGWAVVSAELAPLLHISVPVDGPWLLLVGACLALEGHFPHAEINEIGAQSSSWVPKTLRGERR